MMWHAMFMRLVHHVRASGWVCAFSLQGQRFRPIGMVSIEQACRVHHNDNRPPSRA